MNKINSKINRWLVRASLMLPAGAAFAEVIPPSGSGLSSGPIKSVSDIETLIGNIFDWVAGVTFTFGAIAVLVAAITYMMAPASEDAVKKAKSWLLYAVIGIGVAVLSLGIPTLLENFFKGN